MTITLNGYSSGQSPIQIDLHKLQIYKYVLSNEIKKSFHENETDLLQYIYYDKEYNNKATLGHLRIIQSKIQKGLEK